MTKFFWLFLLLLILLPSEAMATSYTTIYSASCELEQGQEGDLTIVPESWRSKFPFNLLHYQQELGQYNCIYLFNNYEEYPELYAGAPCSKPAADYFNIMAGGAFTFMSLKSFLK